MQKDGAGESPTPKYERLMDWVIRNILNGVFPDGSTLPSEATLASQMQVSRVTVRQAMALLNERGIIAKQQGRRSVVNAATLRGRPRTLRFAWLSRDPFIGETPVYLEIYLRLQRAMIGAHAQLVFLPMLDSKEEKWVSSMMDSFDGVFLAGVRGASLAAELNEKLKALPNVIEIDDIDDSPAACNICTDNYATGRMAAEYLIGQSRNVLVCVSDSCGNYRGFNARTQGMIDYYAEEKKTLTLFSSNDNEIGTESYGTALKRLLDSQPEIDTVWHPMDSAAIRIRHQLEEIAPRKPGYYRSAGADGIPSVLKNERWHTSLRQPVDEIARLSFQTMLNFSSGERPGPSILKIRPILLPWISAKSSRKADAP